MTKNFTKILLFAMAFLCASAEMKAEDENEINITETTNAEIASPENTDATESDMTLAPALQAIAPKAPDWMKDVADRIKLHGYAQGGYFWNHQGGVNKNSFEIKRVIFWAEAQITPRWSFCFMHDFSSVVQEYYTDFRVTNNKAFSVRLGQFKTGLSYENPLSPTSMELIDVYSEGVTYLTSAVPTLCSACSTAATSDSHSTARPTTNSSATRWM